MPGNPTVTLTVSVPAGLKQELELAFGPFKDKQDEQDAMSRFSNLAVTALLDWLSVKKRYRSLTDQYIDWVEQIYTDLLPQEEAPSTERIYNSLNMPYGQASYIARVLSSKTLVHWRTIAKKELLDVLQDKAKAARKYIKENAAAQGINVEISLTAYHELIRVCSARRRLDRSYVLPQPGNKSGDYRFVSVPSCTIVDLIDNPNW